VAIIALFASLAAIVFSPVFAARVMGLKSGPGKGALVGFVTLGVTQIIGMLAQHLGPLGGLLGIMGALAGWYQVVKVVHGTDTAQTFVFMFWHLFFQLLTLSLLSMLFGMARVEWIWGG
jgi:hypothetical protein